ncbi:hypothetical protein ASPTUDRAFT_817746 [Aspergillus tubingensis CBS 134.48]|uniref:Uncharacterized protein n=1 Tax=Aspergillus tubingensis (strain CBS 134.48) TaxID=767770 RepID=A0A1L9MWC4_ASPTC|nr:hypothetical protein ASPTUDRAFT_817746 [Aspergillus tubingensis CBS 134.48]
MWLPGGREHLLPGPGHHYRLLSILPEPHRRLYAACSILPETGLYELSTWLPFNSVNSINPLIRRVYALAIWGFSFLFFFFSFFLFFFFFCLVQVRSRDIVIIGAPLISMITLPMSLFSQIQVRPAYLSGSSATGSI